MLETLLQDLRHAVRSLRRSPGFAAAAIVTLTLGIGANAAVFSVVDGVLLHPLPFAEPRRLVALHATSDNEPRGSVSYLNFLDWQRSARSFDLAAIWRQDFFVFTGQGPAQQLLGVMVSADFFRTLGLQPVAGRAFRPDEDRLGAPPVAMLGESFWRRQFNADPGAIGQTVVLRGKPHTVIGIAPRAVGLLDASDTLANDVVVPIGQHDDATFRDRGASFNSHGVARLREGVALAQARQEMDTIAGQLARDYPDDNRGKGALVLPLAEDVAGDIRPTVLAFAAAVGFVLLIACANVANLFLVRTAGRGQEVAVRLALGGSRSRIVRQLITEGMLLSAIGGVAGVALAAWGTGAALSILPEALPSIATVGVNVRVLLFTLVASLGTGAAVAIIPAWKSTGRLLIENLRRGRGVRASHRRAQRTIVVAQVALTLVLLLGAGLMVRSLARVWAVDPGYDPDRVLTFFTGIVGERASSADRVRASLRELNDRLSQAPGVEQASLILGAPPLRGSTTVGFWPSDRPKPVTPPETLFAAVGPDYFTAMRIPLRRGRALEARDESGRRPVVVVDEVFARETFPGADPIGRHIRFEGFDLEPEIVGVVGHIAHSGLDKDAETAVRAQLYLPLTQLPDELTIIFANIVGAVVRTRVESPDVIAGIRRDLRSFSADQAVHTESWMREVLAESLASRRFSIAVLGAFAVAALLLAVVGVYGTVSYMVSQRTHEIGLRAALGGRPRDILWMVLGEGGKLAAAGLVLGIGGALATTRLLEVLLFGTSPTDVLTFVSASTAMAAVVLVSCYLPARRASRIEPLGALRSE
jgi:predicted permease